MRNHSYHTAIISFLGLLSGIIFLTSFSSVQAETIRLAWDANPESDIAGYRVYYGTVSRSVSGGYENMIEVPGNVPSPTCTLTLEKGKTYYIAVTAYDSSLESEYSVELRRGFGDIHDDHWAYDFVMNVSDGGITSGCQADNPATADNEAYFCPDHPITRGQMAVFLGTSLGHPPNTCTGQFDDVPTNHPFCGFIERMAADGITGGCWGNNFCPNEPVTRGQMAVFIEVALGKGIKSCEGQFADVLPNDPFCRFIEQLAADGITGGCHGGGDFCPNDLVTRAQMAVFLVTAPAPLLP
jgi:hypothetical protein